jgi:hypothetical protein
MQDAQTQKLLAALLEGPVTAMHALNKLGIYRVSARIHELREAGYMITTQLVGVTNRDGGKCRVAEYRLTSHQPELIPQHPGRGVVHA